METLKYGLLLYVDHFLLFSTDLVFVFRSFRRLYVGNYRNFKVDRNHDQ